jgi:hypothetical protein
VISFRGGDGSPAIIMSLLLLWSGRSPGIHRLGLLL